MKSDSNEERDYQAMELEYLAYKLKENPFDIQKEIEKIMDVYKKSFDQAMFIFEQGEDNGK